MNKQLKKYFDLIVAKCIGCDMCTGFQRECFQHECNYGNLAKKAKLFIAEDESQEYFLEQFASSCCLCGRCTKDCPACIEARDFVTRLRELLLVRHPERLSQLRDFRVDMQQNFFEMLRHEIPLTSIRKVRKDSEYKTIFFPGCALSVYAPELTDATFDYINDKVVKCDITQYCCGNPLSCIGLQKTGDSYTEKLLDHFIEKGYENIITACPNCARHLQMCLKKKDLKIIPLPHVLLDAGIDITPTGKFAHTSIAIHDSCPDRFEGRFSTNLRNLLNKIEFREFKHNKSDTRCCGSGGIASFYNPTLYSRRCASRINEFKDTKADILLCACMGCTHTFKYADPDLEIHHYLELLLGIEVNWESLRRLEEKVWSRKPQDSNSYQTLYQDKTEVFS